MNQILHGTANTRSRRPYDDWPTAPPQTGSPHLVTINKLCSKSPGPMPGKAGFYFIMIMAFVTFVQLVKNIWL